MQQVDDFFIEWNNKALDVDGFPHEQPYQCVDLFNQFNKEILGVGYISANPVGGAIDYFNNFDGLGLGEWYVKIDNTPDPNNIPQKGDVVIWGTVLGKYGHIAVVQSANADGFTSFDQNYGGRFCHFVSHNWNGVLGWIRPKKFINVSPAVAPNQRVVGNKDGVNHRAAPSTGAAIMREWAQGEILTFKGFVHGESVSGNNVWFVGFYTGGYLWSGSFTDTGTHDLSDLTAPTPPVTPPVTPPTTPEPTYSFVKDLACVTEVHPAAIGNLEVGNFPTKPEKLVLHDFGTRGVDTLDSLINTFTKKGTEVSAHFAVSGKRIVQLVSLKDRAYHAGSNGNNFIGVESDPAQDKDTIESVRTLLKELRTKYGYQFPIIKHSSIMPTNCGDDINLANYDITETPAKDTDYGKENNDLLKQIIDILKKIFNIGV